MALSATEDMIIDALRWLDAQHPGPMPLSDLRSLIHRRWDRQSVDRALLALHRDGVIDLQIAADPTLVDAPEAGIWREGRGLIYYVSLRQGGQLAGLGAPSDPEVESLGALMEILADAIDSRQLTHFLRALRRAQSTGIAQVVSPQAPYVVAGAQIIRQPDGRAIVQNARTLGGAKYSFTISGPVMDQFAALYDELHGNLAAVLWRASFANPIDSDAADAEALINSILRREGLG